MKKRSIIIFLLFAIQSTGFAQSPWLISLWSDLANASQDTSRVLTMNQLSNHYKFNNPDSAIYYGNSAVALARKINFPRGETAALSFMSVAQQSIGNYTNALKINLLALKIAEKNKLIGHKATAFLNMGTTYKLSKNYDLALQFLNESLRLYDSLSNDFMSTIVNAYIGETYLLNNQLDSALRYAQLADDQAVSRKNVYNQYFTLPILAQIQYKMGNTNLALSYFWHALHIDYTGYLYLNPNLSIARLYNEINQQDSSIYYAKRYLDIAQKNSFYLSSIEASILLSDIYEKRDLQKAHKYSKMAIAYNDSLNYLRNTTSMQAFTDFDEQERQYELETAKTEFQNRLRLNALLGSSFTLIVIAIFLFVNNRQKQKAKKKIETAYDQLKSTQSQLIQAEKMASLGELTAGIAHEIQNPLNFVNNFAEVSSEMIEELKEERTKEKGERDLVLEEEILDDIVQNLVKINHHGQRASGIVKGMLEHSRTNTGKKELTDINILADEYLRLAYHGLRAKDKSFNADFKTEFDESLPKLNVVSQDIGRVLLNLINNAFYTVSARAKDNEAFKPKVVISTEKADGQIMISVKDNGEGIPEHIRNKIFQPFFTTKPTGQGTGLGLSLAYDIITKGHDGELVVESEEGMGTEFKIILPVV